MSEKQFIVGETFMDYYQIKCEKKDYSRVLAPNTVAKLLNEQQAIIRKLQDLCGKSDGENAKLRMENKRLQEENEKLRQSVEYWQKKYEEGTETFQIN